MSDGGGHAYQKAVAQKGGSVARSHLRRTKPLQLHELRAAKKTLKTDAAVCSWEGDSDAGE